MASEVLHKNQKTFSFLTLSNLKVGVLTALLAQPFEVIRTSSIINQHKINSITFAGMLKIIKLIKDSEGIKGFFRGGGLSIMKTTFGYCFFFTGLESMNYLSDKTEIFMYFPIFFIQFVNALMSKSLTAMFISPVNVLKTRFEVVGNNEYRSISEGISKIFQNEGIRGFYKGLIPTIMRDGPYSGIQYTLYRGFLDIFNIFREKHENSKGEIAVSAAISSSIAIMITYPFDNIRVRYMIYKGKSRGLREVCREVYMGEGMIGFYKGYLPRLLKKICSAALSWSLYEHVKKRGDLGV